MAKQKFQCKGVVKKTGQRVAVEVAAESKEAAIKIAAERGVTIEQITAIPSGGQPAPAAQKQPAQPAAAVPPADDDRDEPVNKLFGGADDELGDLGFGGGPPSGAGGSQATKGCPYCGEQVLAVAIKCKHCGSYLAEATLQSAPAIATAEAPLRRPRGKSSSKQWIIVGSAAAGVLLLLILVVTLWPKASVPTAQPAPAVVSKPAPPAPAPVVTKPEKPKHSPEELEFAAKLVAYLDACDAMARVLQGVPKPEKCVELTKVIRAKWDEVPTPPSGVEWAEAITSAARGLITVAETVNLGMQEQTGSLDLIGQTGSSPEVKEACRKAADMMKTAIAEVRSKIPADCLPKAK
jgi:hypothetical protein